MVGYVRVALDSAVEDVLDRDAQVAAVEDWSSRNGHRLADVLVDEGYTASSDLETRLGLADAFEALRGDADGIVVARLDRLTPDRILQEQLLADLEVMGAHLYSADPNDDDALSAETRDPERRLVREVVRRTPDYRRAMRDLWVRQRVRKFPLDDDTEHASLVRIEQLAEQGVGLRDIAGILSAEGFRLKRSHALNLPGLAKIVRRRSGGSPKGSTG